LQNNKILSLAQETQLLEQRIAKNMECQHIDLVQWIFEKLRIEKGWRVLELCCGTGSQTMRFLELVGDSGHVVALDVANDALEKLNERANREYGRRLSTVAARMEDLPEAFSFLRMEAASFDLIFCGYGLYYSASPAATLQEGLSWLKPNGKIAIVGPYRANNGPLFRLLGECGVEIPQFVLYSSRDFMENAVISWAIGHFNHIRIHTMVNQVTWNNPGSVISYWQNTTFYDDKKLSIVENKLEDYFRYNPAFINEKWVMMVEMLHE
jgi:ubiquinone/menaquinone biosynthesis C-methylase UbiE